MVGEIRDLETADIAIKAAQTGHLVLSTLHTNDAPTTLTRLLNMGVAPFNIASSVILITAQRLAASCARTARSPRTSRPRRCCAPASREEDLDGSWQPYGPVGCDHCKGTGYKGRVGIYQVMPITDEMRQHHHAQRQRPSTSPTRRSAKACATCANPACSRSRQGSPRSKKSKRSPTNDAGTRHDEDNHGHRNRRSTQDVKEYTFVWEGNDEQRPGARRDARRLRNRGHDQPAPPGHPVTKIKRQTFRGGKQGQREGHHLLHPPAGDDDEGRRAAAAVVRHRRARPQQPALLAAADRHQEPTSRPGIEPVAGVPQVPASTSTRCTATWSTPARQAGILDAHARPPRHLQGKDPRHQGQDQVGAVLPDLGHRRRVRRRLR